MNIKDIATADEVKEVAAVGKFSAPNHNPNCTYKHTVLRHAFTQKGYAAVPDILYWHVISEGRSHHSTLSMDGLKEWGLI